MPRKLNILLFIFFLLTGCSVVKKNSASEITTENISQFEVNNDIPFNSLFIPGVQIEVDIDGRSESLIATIKYLKGEWLLSLRSGDGIELGRALFTNDTVLVNDRLNRKLYYGNPNNLRGSYGFGPHDLSLILGVLQSDFLTVKKSDCQNGMMRIAGTSGGLNMNLNYVCNTLLINDLVSEYKGIEEGLFIEYLKYKNITGISLPSLVEIKIPDERITLVIRMTGHKINEIVNTDFIPGNNYENVLIK